MILSVHLIPNASRNEIAGWTDGALKIRVTAPPIEGRANDALIHFLADALDLAPSEVEIEKGATSKYKRIKIPMTEEDVKHLLIP